MHGNRGDIPHRIHIPDFPEQLLLRKDMIRIFCQERQQIKFTGGKILLYPIDPDTAGRLVDFQAPDLNYRIFLHIAVHQALIPVQMRLHARYQLTGTERLCHVIVRSKPQAPDFVYVILLCRNHDNRNIFLLPYLPANLKSVHARQHQIENHQLEIFLHRALKASLSVRGDLHLKAGKLQIILLQIGNRFLILYNQYLTHDAGTS